MCIIIYKPENVPFIDEITLWNCYIANPDGIGYMTPSEDGRVLISRGHSDVQDLVEELERNVDPNFPIIYHFRIGTSGVINLTNCHPFPVTPKTELFENPMLISNVGFAHNGTLPSSMWKKDELKTLCDTALFVRDVVYPTAKAGYRVMDATLHLSAAESKSRFAVMIGTGKVGLYGEGWIEEDEVWYSNTSYEHYYVSKKAYQPTVWTPNECELCGKSVWGCDGFHFCKDCNHTTVTTIDPPTRCPVCYSLELVDYEDGRTECSVCHWMWKPEKEETTETICWSCDTVNGPEDGYYCKNCGSYLGLEPPWRIN